MSVSENLENQPLNVITDIKSECRDQWFVLCAACIICSPYISVAACLVWTSPALPKLKVANGEENPLVRVITLNEEAVIGSLFTLGLCIGPIFGKICDVIGRKWTIICISAVQVISLIILAVTDKIYCICLIRLLQGASASFGVSVLPLYLAEIADDHNRGKVGTVLAISVNTGNAYGFIMGALLKLRPFTLSCAAPALISIPFLVIFIPESPIYLIIKKRHSQARIAFQKYRHINVIESDILVRNTEIDIMEMTRHNKGIIEYFRDSGTRKAIFIAIGLPFIVEGTGLMAIHCHYHRIFPQNTITLSPNVTSVVMSCFQVLSVFAGSLVIEKFGRKTLLLLSSAIVEISLIILGVYFFLEHCSFVHLQLISWLPIVCIVFFVFGYCFGVGPVYFVLLGELFPPDLKSLAASLSIMISGIIGYIITFLFPYVMDNLGTYYCFWILAAVSAAGFIFGYYYIPETKGKTFLEIQQMLRG